MKRLLPFIVLGPLFLGGAVLAQEDPIFDDLTVDIGAAIAEAHEAIASGISEGISEALVTTAGDILDPDDDGDGIPDIIDPDDDDDAVPGGALLELLAAIVEEAKSGLQQGRVLLDSDFGP